jgi:hypothetical protein
MSRRGNAAAGWSTVPAYWFVVGRSNPDRAALLAQMCETVVMPTRSRSHASPRRRVDFTHLYFGKASAEREVSTDEARFLRTYLDRWDLPRQVFTHEKFLILGPKGSGKSAAAFFVAGEWERALGNHAVFASAVDFDELNRTQSPLYALDKKLVSEEVSSLTDAAWKLFIGVRLLDSLVADNGCNLCRDSQVLKFVDDLRAAGLASDDYPQVLRRVRERNVSISLPKLASAGFGSKDSDSVSPVQLGDAILRVVENAETSNRHLLSIDGLDKAIGENDAYWRTLAALIRVGDSLCRRLQFVNNQSVYILIMCRSDVFRHIKFSDAPKIASDSGVQMEWGTEAQNPLDVQLWEYIARKAEVDLDKILSLLPKYIEVGAGNKISTPKFLLEFTRYTPRDMSLLFTQIQRQAFTYMPVTQTQVRAGADRFASNDLLNEIQSEAVGLLPSSVLDRFDQILSGLPFNIFKKSDLQQAMREAGITIGKGISVDEFGEYLFLQGAIGNYKPESGYIQFYHRRNTAGFNRKGPWMLQTGLTYALNVPFARAEQRRGVNDK